MSEGTTRKILIVDDQMQMREMLRYVLVSNGFKDLLIADNGREAMQLIHKEPLAAVITDWAMPHMSGIEILKTIRNNADLFEIPVLLVTGAGSPEKVLYAVEEDVDGFIIKPFSPKGVIGNLERVLHNAANPDVFQQKLQEIKRLKLSGKYEEALKIAQPFLKLKNQPKAALLACECLIQLKQYGSAIEVLADTSEKDQTSKHSSLLGKISCDLQKYPLAIKYLEESFKKIPLNHSHRIDLARAYFKKGQMPEAQQIIEGIANSDPTDLVLVEIAQLYIDLGDLDKAGYFLAKTVNPIEETVNVFNNYAVALRKAGKYEECTKIYIRCLKIVPDSDVLRYNLACLYAMTGDTGSAKEALQNSLQLNPENKASRELLVKLSAVEKCA